MRNGGISMVIEHRVAGRESGSTFEQRGFLSRLARDQRGNTLFIVAAAIFPLIGMIGGGVDLSRMYLVKTRLQHACDAGALAGRKQMGAGAWTTGGTTSSDAVAKVLFDGNFPSNAYGAIGATRSFSEAGGTVTGTASATVPMTLMAVFDAPQQLLTVSCSAQQMVPNTDVVFVLDTTESMSQNPDGTNHRSAGQTPGANSKILALKAAVKCFFEALTKQDTGEATCEAITGTVTSARLRFGLVPYATNVDISALGLPDSYFAQSWDYQSRRWLNGKWRYQSVPHTLTGFKNSTTSLSLPLGPGGANKSVEWEGCVEEKAPLTNINAIPDVDGSPKYGPLLPGAVFYRAQRAYAVNKDGTDNKGSAVTTVTPGNLQAGNFDSDYDMFSAAVYPYSSCPAPAYPLTVYGTGTGATAVATFLARVDAMKHAGNTRHDIGMLWGGRLLSPRGIFSAANGPPPNGGPLYRHLIFMTDGDAKANECDYATYGVPWYDKRETFGDAVDGSACNNLGDPNEQLTGKVYDRLAALCTAVKAENNTILWVISFGGTGITQDTKNKLTTCATGTNYFFDATSNDKLQEAFKKIAAQISQLRLAS